MSEAPHHTGFSPCDEGTIRGGGGRRNTIKKGGPDVEETQQRREMNARTRTSIIKQKPKTR